MRHNLNPELYGNYIGVVINKDDPENRCRVQVFIPHLSTTLYENWNKDLKDITIKQGSLDGIPTAVKQRLIEILPWAEAALPLIGPGGSTYADKATDSTRLTNQAPSYIPMTGFKDVRGTGVSDPNGTTISGGALGSTANPTAAQQRGYSDAALHYAMRMMAAESGAGTGLSPQAIYSQLTNTNVLIALAQANELGYKGQYTADVGAKIRQSPGFQPNKMDIGYAQFNTNNLNSETFAKTGTVNSGSFNDQVTSFARFVQRQADAQPAFANLINRGQYAQAEATIINPKNGAGYIPNYVETPGSDRWDGRVSNRRKFETNLANNYGGDINKMVEDLSFGTYSNGKNKMLDTPTAQALLGPDFKRDTGGAGGVNTNATGDVNNIARHIDQVPVNGGMNTTSSQGSFSIPLEGSFVWVFFMGGDINRPNYFGYVAEPNCGNRIGPGASGGRFGNGALISGGASSSAQVGGVNDGKAIPFEGAKLPELTPEQLAAKKVQANGTVTVPLYVNGKLNYGAQVNIETARNFQGFVTALTEGGYKINSIGGFADRSVRGGSAPSWHSTGNAIDINEDKNRMLAYLETDMPSNVSQIAAAYGLGWGGDWTSKKDAMHFSAGIDEGGKLMNRQSRYPSGQGH
jgi:hypothetical protein